MIKVTFTADKDILAGETVTFDYLVPKSGSIRGIVAGIPLTEMTDDQLKIEYRNANSVFYKTKKANKDVTKSESRLNACKAEMDKRGIQPTARASATIDATTIAELIKAGKINVDELQARLTPNKSKNCRHRGSKYGLPSMGLDWKARFVRLITFLIEPLLTHHREQAHIVAPFIGQGSW